MSINQKLMKAIGAPSSNPMPPGQHRFFLSEGETDVNRFVAWVWEGTIGLGHPTKGFGPRSPYRVDEKGNISRIEDAADYFGWDHAYARRILRRAKEQGRVKTDDRRRIWLTGEIVPCEVPEEQDEAPDSIVDTRQQKDCTRYVPAYILLKIQEWSKEEIEKFRREEGAIADRYDRRLADAAAQVRDLRDQEQDARWKEYGLPKRRKINPEKKKKRAIGPVTVQVKLVDLSGEDEANKENSVQSSGDERTVQSENAASVQSSYPLVLSENYQRTTTDAPPSNGTAPAKDDVVVVLEKLKAAKAGWVGKPAAQKILDDCRKLVPDCPAEEVAAIAAHVAPKINLRTQRNPEGALIRAVPQKLKEHHDTNPPPVPAVKPDEEKINRDRAQYFLDNPEDVPADMLEWARSILGEHVNGVIAKGPGS